MRRGYPALLSKLDAWIEQTRELSAPLPFGDSAAKKLMFAHGQEGPAQELRHHALQLKLKLADLKRTELQRAEQLLDLADLQRKLRYSLLPWKRKRYSLEIERLQWELDESEKVIADAWVECEVAQARIEALPRIVTREDFERSEGPFWVNKLLQQAHDEQIGHGRIEVGTIQALRQVGITINRDVNGQLIFFPDEQRLAAIGVQMTDLPLLSIAPSPNLLAPSP